jgi:hypothetical protein
MRAHRPRRWGLGVAVAIAWLVTWAPPAPAQAPVRVLGMVQWVAATRMAVITEFGESVAVDLMQADQSTYRALRGGDRVLVDGTLSSDRRHVIARDIWRDDSRGGWTQAP